MISSVSDCGIEAYDDILEFSDASTSDFDGSTPMASGSDGSHSPRRLSSGTGRNVAEFPSQRHLKPIIRVSRPPRDRREDSDNGTRCSRVGCETEYDSYNSDSSSCSPGVAAEMIRARQSDEITAASQAEEIIGVCSDGNASCPSDNDSLDDDWLGSDPEDEAGGSHRTKLRHWKKLANGKFEEMLLDCIVNTDDIAANYGDIFASRAVIDRLERTTSLSLRRQEAFSIGVLRNHKVTGAILYGPPGTGKSLLAKALAKASNFNMISISTAEVWQKCHGDDEKMVQAIFRLARKLHPCIVFVDEADAMLGQRKRGERRHLKAMVNQFLMEWDGPSTGKKTPFILLATNRPTDLDPAVIRRAPEHIYMGKPTTEERAGIIALLLRGEKLAPRVSPQRLATMTEGYTGSDLKSVCVTAATICVGQQTRDTKHRVLEYRHFAAALKTMGASRVKQSDHEEYNQFGRKVESNSFGGAGNDGQDDEDAD